MGITIQSLKTNGKAVGFGQQKQLRSSFINNAGKTVTKDRMENGANWGEKLTGTLQL